MKGILRLQRKFRCLHYYHTKATKDKPPKLQSFIRDHWGSIPKGKKP